MTVLHLDFESFAHRDLRKVGAYEYVACPHFDVTVIAWAFDDGPVKSIVWPLTKAIPTEIAAHIMDDGLVHAWNASFEWIILTQHFGMPVALEQMVCTMQRALANGLPAALGDAGPAMGLNIVKDTAARSLMLRMGKPKKDGTLWHATDPGKLGALELYCQADVAAEREVGRHLPLLSKFERKVSLIDARSNLMGVQVDDAAVAVLISAREHVRRLQKNEVVALTNGAVTRIESETAKLMQWLASEGLNMKDLTKEQVARHVGWTQLSPKVRRVLELRQASARSSLGKLEKMLLVQGSDGRARGLLQYYGAGRTGRWAGRLIQVQNLPRGVKGIDPEGVLEIAAMDPAALDLFWDPLEALTTCLRGCLTAGPGKLLAMIDLSQIEARVLAWLAGQVDILGVFRSGQDVYTYAAGRLGSLNRQLGKVVTLACVGHGTEVLTDKGWIAIQNVTQQHLLWDGLEWIRHRGLVHRGERETLDVCGARLTPDHRVLCGTQWLPAQSLAQDESILCRALATGSENCPSPASSPERGRGYRLSLSSAIAGLQNISSCSTRFATAARFAATPVPAGNRSRPGKSTGVTPAYARMTIIDGGCSTGSPRASTGARTPTPPSTRIMGLAASACMAPGPRGREWGSVPWGVPISFNTWSAFPAGMTRLWNWIASTWTRATSPAICALSVTAKTSLTGAASPSCKPASPRLKRRLPTYDLAYAGPRNRYTIRTDAGPLIVHNCGYGMGPGRFQETALSYGVTLTAKEAEAAVLGWRQANPKIVAFWYDLERAARQCIKRPGLIETVGRVRLRVRDGKLLIEKPDKGVLVYRNPRIEGGDLVFDGVGQTNKKWGPQYTYGGKLAENVTQAVARDVMADAMVRIEEKHRVIPVMTVHDELVYEVERGTPMPQILMSDMPIMPKILMNDVNKGPAWGVGLPIASKLHVGFRYGK